MLPQRRPKITLLPPNPEPPENTHPCPTANKCRVNRVHNQSKITLVSPEPVSPGFLSGIHSRITLVPSECDLDVTGTKRSQINLLEPVEEVRTVKDGISLKSPEKRQRILSSRERKPRDASAVFPGARSVASQGIEEFPAQNVAFDGEDDVMVCYNELVNEATVMIHNS